MAIKEILIKELSRPYGEEFAKGVGWRKNWTENNERILGWSAKAEHLALYNAARIGLGDALEIGCFLGRSTVHLAAGVKVSGRNNIVHVIDPFFDPFKVVYDNPVGNADNPIKNGTVLTGLKNTFTENLKNCKVDDKVVIHHGFSNGLHGLFQNKSIGTLFIDGNHTYEAVKQDYNLYFPKVVEGGLILFHDVIPDYQGILQLIKELESDSHNGLEKVTNIVSLGIYRKRN